MGQPSSHFVDQATSVAKDVLARHAAQVDQQARWPSESMTALAQSGLMGLTVPEVNGGAGQGPKTFAAVLSTLAEQCASTGMIYLMHICGAQTIASAPGFAQRDDVLKAIAAGKHLTTLAFSEKGSRSHFWAPVSQARISDGRHSLTAEKSWVTSAGHADSYVVSSRAANSTDPVASTLYFVPKGATGLAVSGPWSGLGLRGNASSPMKLDNVSVPSSDLISKEGEGFGVMLNTVLPWFQLGSAAVARGIARSAVNGTRGHLLAAKLEHLGQSLADLPNLRAELARMQIITDSQSAFLDHVAGRMENPQPDTMLAVLESKASATEAVLDVTDRAMRVCGGTAFSGRLPVERNFRDARAGSVMAPTSDILYEFIGKALLGMPLF